MTRRFGFNISRQRVQGVLKPVAVVECDHCHKTVLAVMSKQIANEHFCLDCAKGK